MIDDDGVVNEDGDDTELNGTKSQQGGKRKASGGRNESAGVRAAVRRQKALTAEQEDCSDLDGEDEGVGRAAKTKQKKVSEGVGNGGDVRKEQDVLREISERWYATSDNTPRYLPLF